MSGEHGATRVRRTGKIHAHGMVERRVEGNALRLVTADRQHRPIEQCIDGGELRRPAWHRLTCGDKDRRRHGAVTNVERDLLTLPTDEEAGDLVVVRIIREALGRPQTAVPEYLIDRRACGVPTRGDGDCEHRELCKADEV